MGNHKLFKVDQNAVIVNDEEQILILRQEGKWLLPGGRIEEGESWSEALSREIDEETGLKDVIIGDVLDVAINDTSDTYIVTFWCIAHGTPAVRLSAEHDAYAWITPEDLGEYDFWHPSIPERIRIASSL